MFTFRSFVNRDIKTIRKKGRKNLQIEKQCQEIDDSNVATGMNYGVALSLS